MASTAGLSLDPDHAWKDDSIEERSLSAALMCLEGHYMQSPVMGPQTISKVMSIVSKTLEKTHTLKDVREILSRNLRIWIWLRRAVSAALCDLNEKSLGVRSEPMVPTKFIDITTPEITALIIKNYAILKEALQMLNKLMHIARNLLVTTDPQVPQDLSAAISFDHEVYEAICLCVNVTSKGIDGEIPDDDASRVKLNEITELYKKVLVASLQQAHNWVAKNSRNKMTFWFRVLIESPDVDNNPEPEDRHEQVLEYPTPRALDLREEIMNWMKRNSHMSSTAASICRDYFEAENDPGKNPWLPHNTNLAWNYTPQETWAWSPDMYNDAAELVSRWEPEEDNKFEQDRLYGRVSHELDEWWQGSRLPNPENWALSMYPIDYVPERIKECEANLMRLSAELPDDHHDGIEHSFEESHHPEWHGQAPPVPSGYAPEYEEYEEDPDDDDSYGEGPMTGLLTEVPNILDPKQIEALHMIVKSCILGTAGSGLTQFDENPQNTRCRIFLATDCGKNLLREMLVFIAVWEKDDQSLIFQLSSQIVQAIHENSLIPYAWSALRSPKDIISPAQAVLLRLITFLIRTVLAPPKNYNPTIQDAEIDENETPLNEDLRLGKMVNFFYGIFRSRIVPECVALMQLQGEVRKGQLDPADFPVDNWDLERAKDGLVQYLDFLFTIADIYPLRQHLVDYETVYELLKLLDGLDVGVEKLPFAGAAAKQRQQYQDSSMAGPATPSTTTSTPLQTSSSASTHHNPPPPPPPPPPPLSEPPHEFPWSNIKGQVLSILAALLQPPPGQSSPGNPTVQLQIVQHNGIVTLLNCCLYDDNNRYCRERTQICLKWLLDGSPEAAQFMQNLVQTNNPANNNSNSGGGGGGGATSQNQQQAAGQRHHHHHHNHHHHHHHQPPTPGSGGSSGPGVIQNVRVDGVPGEVRVQVRSSSAPASGAPMTPPPPPPPPPPPAAPPGQQTDENNTMTLDRRVGEHRSRSEELVNDLLALTVVDENGRLAVRSETEEEEEEEEEEEDPDETDEEFM